jgi:AraC-like DNA-binding protein
MKDVIQYCFEHYTKSISLAEVASVAVMSNEAFCRYFKRHTSKSFISFLNEIRVVNAGKMILHTDMPIKEIAWSVGFNNITHFNRVFKQLNGVTPKEYRKNKDGMF